jgi:hypothetical protein
MMTAVQGIFAAGTVAYLTRDATWEKITFTSNHLFYLVGIAAQAAAAEIPYFSAAATVVFCLTPISLIEHFRQGQVSTKGARSFGFYFNRFYYTAAVASTLVLVALGHTAYGVGFFSIVALDMISRSERVNAYAKKGFEWSANATALLTFASYAAKLATPRGQYIMTIVAAQVFLPRICMIIRDTFLDSSAPASDSHDNNDKPRLEQRPIYPWSDQWQMRFNRYIMMPVGFVSSRSVPRSVPGAFLQGLQNLTGKLPHNL